MTGVQTCALPISNDSSSVGAFAPPTFAAVPHGRLRAPDAQEARAPADLRPHPAPGGQGDPPLSLFPLSLWEYQSRAPCHDSNQPFWSLHRSNRPPVESSGDSSPANAALESRGAVPHTRRGGESGGRNVICCRSCLSPPSLWPPPSRLLLPPSPGENEPRPRETKRRGWAARLPWTPLSPGDGAFSSGGPLRRRRPTRNAAARSVSRSEMPPGENREPGPVIGIGALIKRTEGGPGLSTHSIRACPLARTRGRQAPAAFRL